MPRPSGICKLCQTETLLCRSHILPEFLYQFCYHEDGTIRMLNSEYPNRQINLRMGRWEYLLCSDCEALLNDNYENYANSVLYRDTVTSVDLQNGFAIYRGVDYSKFKLFLISLLWRLSVTGDLIGREVNIPLHEEQLRTMLLSENPGQVNQYACFMMIPFLNGRWLNDFVNAPELHFINGHQCYRFLAGGFGFVFVLPKTPFTFLYPQLFLQTDGTLQLKKYSMDNTAFINDYAPHFI